MSGDDVVTLSRLQFAITAMYHFLFVPIPFHKRTKTII